ncbi:MAG: enoyl-CoA hydratase [Inquilinus sp.]|nr:enoyl-CoA hydratase [Inquilinus sp.]
MDRNVETLTVLARNRTLGDTWHQDGADSRMGTFEAPQDGENSRTADWYADLSSRFLAEPLEESDVEVDPGNGICWCSFDYTARPCFSPAVIRDIGRVHTIVRATFEARRSAPAPLKYLAWRSRMPGVWNLGGDLRLIVDLVRRNDREGLEHYAYRSVHELHTNWVSLNLPILTAVIIQGDALGGGFEAALSSNLIVAEKRARFGLPEILFNLFPGMGAYSFLARRASPAIAHSMVMSGRIYEAEELHKLGIIDVLAEDGKGEEAFYDYVAKNAGRHNAHRAILSSRQQINPLTLKELQDVADIWVDTALALSRTDIRKMERLVGAQDRQRARVQTP